MRLVKEQARRSIVFKVAYWGRISELAPLMTLGDQARAEKAAHDAGVSRRAAKALRLAVATGHGDLSLETADKMAKHYSLWATRRQFDWDSYPPTVEKETRDINAALLTGFWALDVDLRRDIELLIMSGRVDPVAAARLRGNVEALAGTLAADLEVAANWHQQHPMWEEITQDFKPICNDLDGWLVRAGSPSLE
jgi:hypothetical protein